MKRVFASFLGKYCNLCIIYSCLHISLYCKENEKHHENARQKIHDLPSAQSIYPKAINHDQESCFSSQKQVAKEGQEVTDD